MRTFPDPLTQHRHVRHDSYVLSAYPGGTADDLSFIAEMLPSYLFPNDERRVSLVSVTGKSLGGHSSWHVLARTFSISSRQPHHSRGRFVYRHARLPEADRDACQEVGLI